ncbi:MAG: PHP domain-containing protein [Bacteroidales bacterium]|nr:PHP domain-containing protein [Bacteroidales bacterium]
MARQFTHLHVHTQFSLLDGQASVKALVDKAMADGMKGIAITDHGNMFGVKEFFDYISKKNKGTHQALKELKGELKKTESTDDVNSKGINELNQQILEEEQKLFKPIIGSEMYVAPRGLLMKEGRPDQGGYHLVVLAKNQTGYHNLIKLVSKSWVDGFYMRPRTDRAELEKYSEGLIVSSACLGGEIPRKIRENNLDGAREAIQWFQRVFEDDFYIELQRHKATVPRANHETYLIQEKVNEQLIALAREFNVKIICTNDVHFVSEEHAEAHDRLICLSTGRDLDDPERMLYSKQEWMKTREEMALLFQDIPEALDNTMEIYDKIEYYSINHAPIMPTFDIPTSFGTEEEYRKKYSHQDLYDEFTQSEKGEIIISKEEGLAKVELLGGYDKMYRLKLEADYLKELTYKGAKKLYGDSLSEELRERLDFELYVMKTMGFPGYFLIVQDFINAARYELDVSVGPGRGSAAGSAVAYCLGITRIDPIKYDLLFLYHIYW